MKVGCADGVMKPSKPEAVVGCGVVGWEDG